jgi:hypothetical protein
MSLIRIESPGSVTMEVQDDQRTRMRLSVTICRTSFVQPTVRAMSQIISASATSPLRQQQRHGRVGGHSSSRGGRARFISGRSGQQCQDRQHYCGHGPSRGHEARRQKGIDRLDRTVQEMQPAARANAVQQMLAQVGVINGRHESGGRKHGKASR